jgi:hypothetical protein
MIEVFMTRRDDGSFLPSQDEDREKLSHVQSRQTIKVKCSQVRERNYMFLKKFMALMTVTFENLPEELERFFPNMHDLRRDVTIQSGFYEIKYNVFGEETKVPKSISFGKMDAATFNDLYNKSIDTIIKNYLIGADADMIKEEVIIRIASHF